MYVCVCVCMYVCRCVFECMYVCMHLCMYACVYVRMYVCMYVRMHLCTHVCIVHTLSIMYVRNYELYTYVRIMYVRTYICVYICIYVSIYLYIYIGMHVSFKLTVEQFLTVLSTRTESHGYKNLFLQKCHMKTSTIFKSVFLCRVC